MKLANQKADMDYCMIARAKFGVDSSKNVEGYVELIKLKVWKAIFEGFPQNNIVCLFVCFVII